MTEERRLSDADVIALADEMERRIVRRFYGNLGRGIWSLVWRIIVWAIVGIAAYGIAKGMK